MEGVRTASDANAVLVFAQGGRTGVWIALEDENEGVWVNVGGTEPEPTGEEWKLSPYRLHVNAERVWISGYDCRFEARVPVPTGVYRPRTRKNANGQQLWLKRVGDAGVEHGRGVWTDCGGLKIVWGEEQVVEAQHEEGWKKIVSFYMCGGLKEMTRLVLEEDGGEPLELPVRRRYRSASGTVADVYTLARDRDGRLVIG